MCTCMRSVLVAVGGVQLRKALTQEAVHWRFSAGLVVAVARLAVPTTAVLQAKLIHLIQRVPGERGGSGLNITSTQYLGRDTQTPGIT